MNTSACRDDKIKDLENGLVPSTCTSSGTLLLVDDSNSTESNLDSDMEGEGVDLSISHHIKF